MVPGQPLCAWPCFRRSPCINLLDPHEESEVQGSRAHWEPGLQLMVAKNQGPVCPQLPHSPPREAPRSKGQEIPSMEGQGDDSPT